jgi:hypothetical protein
MKRNSSATPPRWVESLLIRVLPPSRRDDIAGDLCEEFRARRAQGAPASFWYTRQAAGLIGRQLYGGGKMRTILLAFCAFTLLACCWLTVMEGVLRHPGYPARMIMDGLLGVGSLLTAIIVLLNAATGWRWLGLAAALGAGAVGVAAIVHNARAPHFEGFAVVIGAALSMQAALTLWFLGFRRRSEHA